MENNAFSKKLEDEIRLQISLGKKAYRNVLTALNTIRKNLGGEPSCLKLLSDDGTSELLEALVCHLEDKGKSTNFIYPAKTNLQTLASIAKNLFPKQTSSSEDGAVINTKIFKVSKSENKPLAVLVELATQAYYEGLPCATYKGKYSKVRAQRDIDLRSNGIIKEKWLRQIISKHNLGGLCTQAYNLRERYALLEKLLNVDTGMFVSHCKSVPPRANKKTKYKKAKNKTASRASLSELPPHAQAQWDALSHFYLTGNIPSTIAPSFYDDPSLEIRLSGGKTWGYKDTEDGKASTTCGAALETVLLYFGWLHQEHGVLLEDLDLTLLTHFKLIEQYGAYKSENLRSAYKLAILAAKFYKEPQSYGSRYLAPTTYLPLTVEEQEAAREHNKVAEPRKRVVRHTSAMIYAQYPQGQTFSSSTEWESFRKILHANLLGFSASCNDTIEENKLTNVAEAIGGVANVNWALGYKNNGIVGAIDECIRPMIKLLSKWSLDTNRHITERLSYGRTAAFCALEIVRPLRLLNASCIRLLNEPCDAVTELKWESMWVDTLGDYRIHIPKCRLKNSISKSKEICSVSIKIPKGTLSHQAIKRWLSIRKKALSQAGVESEWFLMHVSPTTLGKKMWYLDKNNKLSACSGGYQHITLEALTSLLGQDRIEELNIKDGINPHAWRHLIAHYILDQTNHDVALAAHSLMDSVDMIIKTYGEKHNQRQTNKLEEFLARVAV